MNTLRWMTGPPKRILIATDLSARCDRALDRAVSLAVQWKTPLVVLHVLEDEPATSRGARLPSWQRPPDPATLARKQLLADIGNIAEKATIIIEQGEPAEAIVRHAEAEGCDLIVTGVARDELFGRIILGGTVDRLLRRSRTPVLVVRGRARAPYRHIVVATDFSESSRHALTAAMQFFPHQRLTVFHAYDAPMSGLVSDSTSYQREYRKVAVQDCETFLRGSSEGGVLQPEVLIEQGTPSLLLRDYAREQGADLVVLGTHGRSAIFETLLGSVAKEILEYLPCDALIIREPRAIAP